MYLEEQYFIFRRCFYLYCIFASCWLLVHDICCLLFVKRLPNRHVPSPGT